MSFIPRPWEWNNFRRGICPNYRINRVKRLQNTYRYVITYKPFNILCSRRDRYHRPTLTSLGIPKGLHPAGRLDRDSEGLLLLTNDGDLFHRITHPDFNHPKTYLVLVLGHPDNQTLSTLRDGIEIKSGMTRPADVEVIHTVPPLPYFEQPLPAVEKTTWLRVVLYEGKKRQIKRMTAAAGHPTVRLVRVAIGPLMLPPDIEPGQWRDLSGIERKVLLDWVWPHGRSAKSPRHTTTHPRKSKRNRSVGTPNHFYREEL